MSFVCRKCTAALERFVAPCPSCHQWNTLQDPAALTVSGAPFNSLNGNVEPVAHFSSGIAVWDEALDGGMVLGTSALIGGTPGVGKSTLTLQVAGGYARGGKRVLYASAEEDGGPLKARAKRVGAEHPNLDLFSTGDLTKALAAAASYDIAIYDSIQMYAASTPDFTKPKTRILISQLNGQGSITGTTKNEHLCDALLFADEDLVTSTEAETFFVLRAAKNRNGATRKARYQLTENGAEYVKTPEPKKRTRLAIPDGGKK